MNLLHSSILLILIPILDSRIIEFNEESNTIKYADPTEYNQVDRHDVQRLVYDYMQFLDINDRIASNVSVKCVACQATVYALNWLWNKNTTEDFMEHVIGSVCALLRLEDEDVCHMMSSNYKHEFLYVLGQIILEPREVCGVLMSNCGQPYDPILSNWTLTLPDAKPPVVNLQSPNPSSPQLRVLQLSDIHYDPAYVVGSEVNCNEPLCCRLNHKKAAVENKAGEWISFGACDIPLKTVEDMFRQLSKQKFDYILWTGDLAPHDIWNYSRTRHVEMMSNLTGLFVQYFPDTPVFSAVGNHEGVPCDSFAPNGVPSEYSHDWLYNTLAKQWRTWLPTSAVASIKYRASYMSKVVPGLRIISINTQYCYQTNFWLYINATDPDDTLGWLIEQLTDAEKAGDAVHIIGHVPPGNSGCLPAWSANYYAIVNRFESTIRAQFFGHTHYDSFSVFYEHADPGRRATSMMYIAPSVTSYTHVIPSYRVYDIDGPYHNSTWAVLDHSTFALDMQAADKGKLNWNHLYSAKSAYNMSSLFARDWDRLIDQFAEDPDKFDKYNFYYTRTNTTECDIACRRSRLCELRSARSHDESRLCAMRARVHRVRSHHPPASGHHNRSTHLQPLHNYLYQVIHKHRVKRYWL